MLLPSVSTSTAPNSIQSPIGFEHSSPQPQFPNSSQPPALTVPSPMRKPWRKFCLDLYLRLMLPSQHSYLRIKQTISPLPFLSFKPSVFLVSSASYPVRMYFDIKLFRFFKLRVHGDGSAFAGARFRLPLRDSRFDLDLCYERELRTGKDSVKITCMAWSCLFLQLPRFRVGAKVPAKLGEQYKMELWMKKYLAINQQSTTETLLDRGGRRENQWWQRVAVRGPIGMDLKIRCLESR